MGRTWHPEHFVCTHCQEEIGSRNFFEREGQPYCETDYHHLFSPRCYYCNGPILDVSLCWLRLCSMSVVENTQPTTRVVMSVQKVVTALDRTWHPEHFFCAQCGSFFGPEGNHIYSIRFFSISIIIQFLIYNSLTIVQTILFAFQLYVILNRFVISLKASMRRMERPFAGRITLTCLHQNVAAVPEPFWRTTSQR